MRMLSMTDDQRRRSPQDLCSTSRYRPEIDGLRAIAILAVLLNHTDERFLPGGYVGVDVFFVISGFLITSLILRDVQSQSFSFLHFYARRVRRLLPAATAAITGTLAAAYFLLLPLDFQALGSSATACIAMLANHFFCARVDYFDPQQGGSPLLHIWSLAVEEQFYLAYPFALVVIHRTTRKWSWTGLAMLLLCSLGYSVFATCAAPRSAFYLLPSRAWELLVGCLVSRWSPRTLTPPMAYGVVALAVVCILAPMALYSSKTPFPGVAALPPVMGTALLLWVTGSDCAALFRAVLTWPPLTFIGRISYSLYLWHWPAIVLAKYPWSAQPSVTPAYVPWCAALGSGAIAIISYFAIESPLRKTRCTDGGAIGLGVVASGILGFASLTIYLTHGLPGRLPADAVRYANGSLDQNPRRSETEGLTAAAIKSGRQVSLGQRTADSKPMFAIWGDSHADALVPLFDSLATQVSSAGTAYTKGLTPPLVRTLVKNPSVFTINYDFTNAAAEHLGRESPPHVVLAARWSVYLDWGVTEHPPFPSSDDEKVAAMARAIERTLDTLRRGGAQRIWLVREVPWQDFDVPRRLAFSAWHRAAWPAAKPYERYRDDVRKADRVLEACIAHASDVTIMDISQPLFASGNPLVTPGGSPVYWDSNHLSVSGSWLVRDEAMRIFSALLHEVRDGHFH